MDLFLKLILFQYSFLYFSIKVLSTKNVTEASAIIRIVNEVANENIIDLTNNTLTTNGKLTQICCEILVPKCQSVYDPYLKISCTYSKETKCGDICIEKKQKSQKPVKQKPIKQKPEIKKTEIPTNTTLIQNTTLIPNTTLIHNTKSDTQPQLKALTINKTKTTLNNEYPTVKTEKINDCIWPYYYNCLKPAQYIPPIQEQQQSCAYVNYWPYILCNYNNQISNYYYSNCNHCYYQTTTTTCPVICSNANYNNYYQLPCNDFYSCYNYYGTIGNGNGLGNIPWYYNSVQICCEVLIPKCKYDSYFKISCTYSKERRCGDRCFDKKQNEIKTPINVRIQRQDKQESKIKEIEVGKTTTRI